jgi:hypothetical protein
MRKKTRIQWNNDKLKLEDLAVNGKFNEGYNDIYFLKYDDQSTEIQKNIIKIIWQVKSWYIIDVYLALIKNNWDVVDRIIYFYNLPKVISLAWW